MDSQSSPWATWERNFVEQMQRLREARRLTQTDLARELQAYGLRFHQQTIQRIESGERPVRLNEAHLIAKALGVSLDSMTATGTPASRELRYGVDRLRRSAGSAAEELGNSLGEWLEDVEAFSLALSDRINTNKSQQDEVTRWGLAWAQKALWAYHAMVHAWENLTNLEGAPTHLSAEGEWEVTLPRDDVIDALDQWISQYRWSEFETTALSPPNQLYAEFPDSEARETPAEVRLGALLDDLDRSIHLLKDVSTNDERVPSALEVLQAQRYQVATALERLSAGIYGVCVDCGVEIPRRRLEIRPEAARCVSCQESRSGSRSPGGQTNEPPQVERKQITQGSEVTGQ